MGRKYAHTHCGMLEGLDAFIILQLLKLPELLPDVLVYSRNAIEPSEHSRYPQGCAGTFDWEALIGRFEQRLHIIIGSHGPFYCSEKSVTFLGNFLDLTRTKTSDIKVKFSIFLFKRSSAMLKIIL